MPRMTADFSFKNVLNLKKKVYSALWLLQNTYNSHHPSTQRSFLIFFNKPM